MIKEAERGFTLRFCCRKVFYLMCCAFAILFSSDYDSKLPIVLFVGQHFSGSLFEWVHLSI